MADYWKSQPRKFCEFCKCWLTDNKPSVEFHEKGKRHQENVKKKIDTIKKKSLADAKKQSEMESDMEKLNRAALEAFKKDIINDPSLAAQYGVSLESLKKKKETKVSEQSTETSIKREPSIKQEPIIKQEPSIKEEATEDIKPKIKIEKDLTESTCELSNSDVKPPKTETDWYEAVSDEGYHYYWNVKTNESVWETPTNYVSLEEQAEDDSADSGSNVKKEKSKVKVKLEPEEIKEEDPNAVFEGPMPRNFDSRTREETCTSRKAYGKWVTNEEDEPVDYELPEVQIKEIPLPDFTLEEPVKIKFKEKRVTSLSKNGEVTAVAFKKRKVTKGARNMRSRDASED